MLKLILYMTIQIKVKIKEYNHCRLCRSNNIYNVIDLGCTSPANAYQETQKDSLKQEKFPLQAFLCFSCYSVQLKHTVDPNILFQNYKYSSSTVVSLVDHFKDYAADLKEKHIFGKCLEIGSNDGILLSELKNLGCSVLGVEPSTNLAEVANAKGLPTLPSFFNKEEGARISKEYGKFDLICANNVFAHIDDLHSVTQGIVSCLSRDGVFVFENAYLMDTLDGLYFDQIYHEHLYYHSIHPLKNFFEGYGLEIFNIMHNQNQGGSIRVFVKWVGSTKWRVNREVIDRYLNKEQALFNRGTFTEFNSNINNQAANFKQFLNKRKAEGKTFSAFGAPAKLTTFSEKFGLTYNNINYVVENSKVKVGLYTPGVGIPIVEPASFKDCPTDYCLITAWNFADKIIENNKWYLDQGGIFIKVLPEFKEVKAR